MSTTNPDPNPDDGAPLIPLVHKMPRDRIVGFYLFKVAGFIFLVVGAFSLVGGNLLFPLFCWIVSSFFSNLSNRIVWEHYLWENKKFKDELTEGFMGAAKILKEHDERMKEIDERQS